MIKKRIHKILEVRKVQKEYFYKKIGMTSANFRGKAVETPINSNALNNIISLFPDLNIHWLITGKGEMFFKDNQTKISIDTKAQKDSLNKLFYNYMELTADTNKNQLTSNDVRNIKELLNNL
ncbi:hypothetical protein [Empedobacter sp. GD03739]|uniref:hypothetical protein n=1 Tax=Empedobacter sp. GD03739 TaxID=2975376 RepID=UPI00244A8F35|nr:hypothetical protein [Empedobacter sp. GD03739]MDH1602238.1 hypothetical protein [Empedobacter sp. GD03739]